MNFLICPAADYQLDDTEGLFKSSCGNFYNFRIELTEDEEMIRIIDTCGRYMPIDITDVANIGKMLSRIAEYVEAKTALNQQLVEAIFDSAEQ